MKNKENEIKIQPKNEDNVKEISENKVIKNFSIIYSPELNDIKKSQNKNSASSPKKQHESANSPVVKK